VGNVEVVLDEMEAAKRALDRSRPGDLVLLCVDDATSIWKELEGRRQRRGPLAVRLATGPDDSEPTDQSEADLLDLEVGL
jgi:cyanophycin synthetase